MVAIVVFVAVSVALAQAAVNDLDSTYGTGGVTSGSPGTDGALIVLDGTVRPGGATMFAGVLDRSGDPFVVGHSPTGSRTLSAAIDLPAGYTTQAAAFTAEHLYLAGTGPNETGFVARALLDGSLDITYGDSATPGIGDLSVTGITAVRGLGLQPLGDPAGPRALVLVARTARGVGTASVIRLTASGRDIDRPAFGNGFGFVTAPGGTVPVDLAANASGIWALVVPEAQDSFTVSRFSADGIPAAFGTSGSVAATFPATPATTTSVANALAVDAQDRPYVAGRLVDAAGAGQAAIVRFTADGARDASFGSGALFAHSEPGIPALVGLAVDSQGLLAGGGEGLGATRVGRTLVVDPEGKQLLGTLRTGTAGDVLHRFVARNLDGRPYVGGLLTGGSVFQARFGGPNVAPSVTLTGPASARPNETFTLTATGTDADGNGGGLTHEWDVDGQPGFERSTGERSTLETSVAAAGAFTARVRVTDASGLASPAAQHSMTIAGNAVPVAAYTFMPTAPTAGTPVAFDASGSQDADGSIQSYSWDFTTDGTTDATTEQASFTYSAKGTYNATLTVTDDAGATDTEVRQIVVGAAGSPPTFSGFLVTEVTNTTARLVFRIEEDGHAALDPYVSIATVRHDAKPTATPGVFAAEVTGLKPRTAYDWQAIATDAETGLEVKAAGPSFVTRNGDPTLTASIPDTAEHSGPFAFNYEAHDDATPDGQLKVKLRVGPPGKPLNGPVYLEGGAGRYEKLVFNRVGMWTIELSADDTMGGETKLTETVDVKQSPSFFLEGPGPYVDVAPGKVRTVPIRIVRDSQGEAPVRLTLSSPDKVPDSVTGGLSDAGTFTTKDSATLKVKAPKALAGKTYRIKIVGFQAPTPVRDIGPRSLSFTLRIVKPTDLVVHEVEVMQAVREPVFGPLPWGGNKFFGGPLIRGKSTLVRVFASYTSTPAIDFVPTARLTILGLKKTIAPAYAPKKLLSGMHDPNNWRDHGEFWYHFIVPGDRTDLAPIYNFQVELDPPLVPTGDGDMLPLECDTCEKNNTALRRQIPYVKSPSYDLRYVRAIHVHKDEGKREVTSNEAFQSLAKTRQLLPLARERFRIVEADTTAYIGVGGPKVCQDAAKAKTGASSGNDYDDAYDDCQSEQADYAFDIVRALGIGKPPDGGLILLHEQFSRSKAWSHYDFAEADITSPVSAVAHEITHLFDRQHADYTCGGDDGAIFDDASELLTDQSGTMLGAYGLVYKPLEFPWATVGLADHGLGYDYMSYCGEESNRWTSGAGWRLNIKHLRDKSTHRVARQAAAAPGALRVTATASDTDAAITVVRPVREVEREAVGVPSELGFVALDASGGLLAGVRGTLIESARPHVGEPRQTVEAVVPAGTRSVTLVRGLEILDTRSASLNAPVVQVTTPKSRVGGSLKPVRVSWAASDADGDQIDVIVDYSSDGGRTWRGVHGGIGSGAEGAAELDPHALRNSSTARLRVTALDGFNATVAESAIFTSRSAPASVRIVEPRKTLRTRAGLSVSAVAEGTDRSGSSLTGKAIRWFLGKRPIGTGQELVTPPLAAGRHELRAVVKGASASRTIRAAGVRPFFTTLVAKRTSRRTARLTIAASAPGTVLVNSKRHRIRTQPTRVRFRVRRSTKRIKLALIATGARTNATVRLR